RDGAGPARGPGQRRPADQPQRHRRRLPAASPAHPVSRPSPRGPGGAGDVELAASAGAGGGLRRRSRRARRARGDGAVPGGGRRATARAPARPRAARRGGAPRPSPATPGPLATPGHGAGGRPGRSAPHPARARLDHPASPGGAPGSGRRHAAGRHGARLQRGDQACRRGWPGRGAGRPARDRARSRGADAPRCGCARRGFRAALLRSPPPRPRPRPGAARLPRAGPARRPRAPPPVSPRARAEAPSGRWMTLLRALAAAAGLAVIAWLWREIGPDVLLAQLRQLSWRLPLVFLPYGLIAALDGAGWRYSFPGRLPSLPLLVLVRLAGEAINITTPTATLGGEPVKAWLLTRVGVPLQEGLVSVVIGKTALVLSHVVFLALGLAL